MNAKTQQLIEKLKTMDTTLARVWDDAMISAFTDANAYAALSGRQQAQVDRLRSIDATFTAGRMPTDDLYVISDGAFKTF